MIEFVVIVGIIILLRIFFKDWRCSSAPVANEERKNNLSDESGIIGKSTFVLNTERKSQSHSNFTGKLDIEVALDYVDVELDEELEELGIANSPLLDLTFEEMMEVVTEVEKDQAEGLAQTGRLLYENENTDWVEQLASTSENYQKRISALIDLHLMKLGQNDDSFSDDERSEFDIGEFLYPNT
ncbi:hypothetical protein [Draconibacterium sediminis]|uniref:Uncharacterized protein n=1 Tax=Draconibacterium sediminis TaxID=1544798 RepID=A0A0D8JCW5_9BACT|nr:hypothetical protein [Draconibacterium sediminis]KJF43643.1 hypothetical protein LH29_11090 [Draconibacterium sediminis]